MVPPDCSRGCRDRHDCTWLPSFLGFCLSQVFCPYSGCTCGPFRIICADNGYASALCAFRRNSRLHKVPLLTADGDEEDHPSYCIRSFRQIFSLVYLPAQALFREGTCLP